MDQRDELANDSEWHQGDSSVFNTCCEAFRSAGIDFKVIEEAGARLLTSGNKIRDRWMHGLLALEGRKIDLFSMTTTKIRSLLYYNYNYIVKVDYGTISKAGLGEKDFDAVSEMIGESEQKSPGDVKWTGGILAQALNSDTELNAIMLQRGLTRISVEAKLLESPLELGRMDRQAVQKRLERMGVAINMNDGMIVISRRLDERDTDPESSNISYQAGILGIPFTRHTLGKKYVPDLTSFEVYEKIAGHIKELMATSEVKQTCLKCGEEFSLGNMLTCELCGKRVCLNCAEYKGFLRKKILCPSCAGK